MLNTKLSLKNMVRNDDVQEGETYDRESYTILI